ncbi:hypothetical protein HDV04_003731 [Boothiomyces sp. JEL0838]|nr:hypothetical protein HDV04_003731 [Boothiomyces sp. JEL0838]
MVPEAYAIVEKNVYRSAAIQQSSFSFYKNLKTILLLSPELPNKSLLQYSQGKLMIENKINLIHLQQPFKSNSWRPVSEELVKEGLEITLNADNHPLLVMCTSGILETGCLYRSFAGNKARYLVEQFIELFDTELVVLPSNLPSWFTINLQLLEEK